MKVETTALRDGGALLAVRDKERAQTTRACLLACWLLGLCSPSSLHNLLVHSSPAVLHTDSILVDLRCVRLLLYIYLQRQE